MKFSQNILQTESSLVTCSGSLVISLNSFKRPDQHSELSKVAFLRSIGSSFLKTIT